MQQDGRNEKEISDKNEAIRRRLNGIGGVRNNEEAKDDIYNNTVTKTIILYGAVQACRLAKNWIGLGVSYTKIKELREKDARLISYA